MAYAAMRTSKKRRYRVLAQQAETEMLRAMNSLGVIMLDASGNRCRLMFSGQNTTLVNSSNRERIKLACHGCVFFALLISQG